MTGAWHVYAEGRAVGAARRASAWLALSANATCARCSSAGRCSSCSTGRASPSTPRCASLGPDLLDDDPQIAVAVRACARALVARSRAIGEVLLDQTIAAGIGNVVRCEALYALRIDPWAPLGSVSDEHAERAARAFAAHPAGRACAREAPCRRPIYGRRVCRALRRDRAAAGDRATRRARCIGAPPARLFAISPVNTI